MSLEISCTLAGSENLCVVISKGETTLAIDAPEAAAIQRELEKKNKNLTHILLTHTHHDHIAGVEELKHHYKCTILGPDLEKTPLTIGNITLKPLALPGHCAPHTGYYLEDHHLLFTGDALFSLGCGRIMATGSHQDLFQSLQKIMSLPDSTKIYCGHEYTLSNAKFALHIDPENRALQEYVQKCQTIRATGNLTLPTTLRLEKACNPFLRCNTPEIQSALKMQGADPYEVFVRLRQMKDRF